MSEVVGSTPSFTRNGRPSSSFWRSPSSLMICAAPRFSDASASSTCMVKHRIALLGRALLVFIQQLAHLLDRERRVLPVQRFLTFAFIQKRPVLCVLPCGNFLG